MRSTGDPMFDLVAATYRQALTDARAGDPEAIQWLDVCCPDWRRMAKQPKKPPVSALATIKKEPISARYKKDVQTMHKGETCSKLSESPTQPPRSSLSAAPTVTGGAYQP